MEDVNFRKGDAKQKCLDQTECCNLSVEKIPDGPTTPPEIA